MSYIDRLASELRERDNKKRIGQQVGKVVSTEPLKISMCDGAIMLDEEIRAVCQTATFLKEGDEVLLEPDEGDQSYIVVDRIRREYGPQIGTVTKIDPLTIEFEDVKLKDKNIKARCISSFEKGDRILCLPCEGEEDWILVSKVV